MGIEYVVTTSDLVQEALGSAALRRWAGAEACRRAASFRRPVDALDHLAVRVLAVALLAGTRPGLAAEAWELTQLCEDPLCRRSEQHGRPTARVLGQEGPAVSWSHADGVIACAVGDVARLGVDAEPVRSSAPPLVGGWPQWVRAEALVKAGFADLDTALAAHLDADLRGVAPGEAPAAILGNGGHAGGDAVAGGDVARSEMARGDGARRVVARGGVHDAVVTDPAVLAGTPVAVALAWQGSGTEPVAGPRRVDAVLARLA